MQCKNCKHYNKNKRICQIIHKCHTISCNLENDNIEDMKICYNCKHWIGGGDWGLSCKKDYYNCSTNGFNEGCKDFERRK